MITYTYKTDRFHVFVRLFSDRSNILKCCKKIGPCFVLINFLGLLKSVSEQAYGNMESVC